MTAVLILCHECSTVIAATDGDAWRTSWDHALDTHPRRRDLTFTDLLHAAGYGDAP